MEKERKTRQRSELPPDCFQTVDPELVPVSPMLRTVARGAVVAVLVPSEPSADTTRRTLAANSLGNRSCFAVTFSVRREKI